MNISDISDISGVILSVNLRTLEGILTGNREKVLDMAFDGITVSNIVYELQNKIIGGRIYKIYQPEPDELNLVIKTPEGNYRLLLSSNATLPLLYLTTKI